MSEIQLNITAKSVERIINALDVSINKQWEDLQKTVAYGSTTDIDIDASEVFFCIKVREVIACELSDFKRGK